MSAGSLCIPRIPLTLAMFVLFAGLMPVGSPVQAQPGGPGEIFNPLGPMPEPPENPLTDAKALLGKFLFWEEQLSHDNSSQ